MPNPISFAIDGSHSRNPKKILSMVIKVSLAFLCHEEGFDVTARSG